MMSGAVLAATLALLATSIGVRADTCDVSDGEKQDCGHLGTNQQSCEQSGCCWQALNPNPNNYPWCYHKKSSSASCPLVGNQSSLAIFNDDEIQKMRSYFRKNINIEGKGGVVASPDRNTPGGSYYYHWERDGALSMEALLKTSVLADVEDDLNAYAGWVAARQKTSDPNGQIVLTEPKYMLPNGEVFNQPWCRPQDDGPGLRAKTLIGFAHALNESVRDAKGQFRISRLTQVNKYITSELWPTIRTDLDWVAANWTQPNSPGCDLWEEIRDDDLFWDRFTMRAALVLGSQFADEQGDTSRKQSYANTAKAIENTLHSHFQNGFVIESQSRQKDAAVICAFNDGYMNDGVFGPTSSEVAGTIKTLNDLFCNSFNINQADSSAGIPGVLYGRYEGDQYAGGNPWILLSAALAELLYRGATELTVAQLNSNNSAYASLLANVDYRLWAQVLRADTEEMWLEQSPAALAKALQQGGDGVLTRIRSHVKDADFHLAEQLDRQTGEPMSAKDLTWSYATVLKATHARSTYFKHIKQLQGAESKRYT